MLDDFRFQWFKINGFLAASHLVAFNTLRIVDGKNSDNLLHRSLVANDASFGTFVLSDVILFGLPMYMHQYLQQILFQFHQPSVEAISCVQKSRDISRFD